MVDWWLSTLVFEAYNFVSNPQKSRKPLLLILFLYSLQTDISRDFYRNGMTCFHFKLIDQRIEEDLWIDHTVDSPRFAFWLHNCFFNPFRIFPNQIMFIIANTDGTQKTKMQPIMCIFTICHENQWASCEFEWQTIQLLN